MPWSAFHIESLSRESGLIYSCSRLVYVHQVFAFYSSGPSPSSPSVFPLLINSLFYKKNIEVALDTFLIWLIGGFSSSHLLPSLSIPKQTPLSISSAKNKIQSLLFHKRNIEATIEYLLILVVGG